MGKHTDFILSPIARILEDVVSANAGIGDGIETFPLADYILQSCFLKMTGFQEQKMKCICWELATNNYAYRYDLTKTPMGEFSKYDDKKKVYQDLIKQIKDYVVFDVANDIDRVDILTTTIEEIKSIFRGNGLLTWTQESFDDFENIITVYQHNHFASDDKTLLVETANLYSLKKIYEEYLYKHRNRCAHNTQSYQENLPTLKTLNNQNYRYQNYFIWFSILVLMDKIFIALYQKYYTVFEED